MYNNFLSDSGGKKHIISAGIDTSKLTSTEKPLEDAKNDLTASNEDFIARQQELSAMYEELMDLEEKLRNSLAKLQKHQEALEKSEERYRLLVEGASDGLWDWDITTNTIVLSERWKNILGFEKQELINHNENWIKRIHPGDINEAAKFLNTHINKRTPYYSCEYRLKAKNGKYMWVSIRGKALWDNEGKAVRMAGSLTDITERKKNENKLEHSAYYDPLTDIPLRTVFMENIKASISAVKGSGLKFAVLFFDIDNFKSVNDIYGHHIGDMLLKRIVKRLKSCIRKSDTLSRIGGDEFALLVTDLYDMNYVDEIANRIIKLFNQPTNVNGYKVNITISIGIAVYPDNGLNGKDLLKKADTAMYKAKEKGKNNLQFFHNYMSKEISSRYDIRKDLRTAIDNKELFLCYQPIIDTKTKKMVCMEALIRWRHPRNGVISPVEFIPIAEETRLIIPIGEWVLQTSCRQFKKWNNMGYNDYSISVNISIIQMQQPDFAEVVSRILEETGLLPKYLQLEITESILMESTPTVAKNLSCLERQGVKISIDDFGTGYCCLEYLQKFSINGLKIDRTFIYNIKTDINKVLVDTIISLGHKLNMEVTAEGVETKEQYKYLKKKGCNYIQGYYFSKPLLSEEVIQVLKADSFI